MICNMDCLHCIYPDCRNDQLTPDDYKASTERDRDSVQDNRDAKGQRRAAYQKAYRAANRDKLAAYQKAYRAANRDKRAAYQKDYDAANRDKRAAQQKAYYAANRDKLAAQQKIRDRRKAAGYTQSGLAALIGVTRSAVSLWENCKGPADWDKLEAVFPNIKKEVLTNDR